MKGPRLIAVVPAAGGGTRFGGDTPKQHADLAGRSVLARTLTRLLEALPLDALYVALAPNDAADIASVSLTVHVLRCGGATHVATVGNVLDSISQDCADRDWILVHDAVRPCVPPDALRRLMTSVADDPVGGLLAVPVADTLKRATDHGVSTAELRVWRTEARAGLWQAQTPQVFRYGVLRAALALGGSEAMTDEAQAVEALAATRACGRPMFVQGSPHNIKITYPGDLALAAAILRLQEADNAEAAVSGVTAERGAR